MIENEMAPSDRSIGPLNSVEEILEQLINFHFPYVICFHLLCLFMAPLPHFYFKFKSLLVKLDFGVRFQII